MLPFRVLNRTARLSRFSQLSGRLLLRNSLRSLSSKPKIAAAKDGVKKTLYPERLIIYHSGTGRTVFIGCLKLTTIFICSFFSLIAAPNHFYSEAEPPWVAAAVLLSGVVPLIFVTYISGPFVNYVHLRLPAFARNSREMLYRYSQSLPKQAEVDITTMNFIGKPRVSRMKISDVFPTKQRFGLVNYGRIVDGSHSQRPWWMGGAPKQFGIHKGRSTIMGGEIWENVARCIAKNKKS